MASTTTSNNRQTVFEIAYLGVSLLGSFLILRWALNRMDPNKNAKEKAKERKKQLVKRLGRPINLDGQYEDVIAQEVVNPANITVTLADIGGLDDIIEDLNRNVITPMGNPAQFRTTLLRQKRGVLLYGPPGTGKTMLAKALARECGACFINLKSSTVLSKWYGDTNKLIHAVWTLAHKLQPSIIFIDEVDSLLGTRRAMEHEATTAMKTEFMQLWEGFETLPTNNVLVLGATNKRDALDEAVMRRFSLQYEVKLPKAAQRKAILELTLLRHTKEVGEGLVDAALRAESVPSHPTAAHSGPHRSPAVPNGTAGGQLRDLAERTEGFSGSDLNEMCSQAAAIPVHAYINAKKNWEAEGKQGPEPVLEPLSKVHFEVVLAHMVPPSRAAQAAQHRRQARQRGDQQGGQGGLLLQHDQVEALAAAIASGLARGLHGPFASSELSEED